MTTKDSRGSAVVVLISDCNKWKTKDIITITIKPSTSNIKDQIKNAFTMEVIALLAASQLLKYIGVNRNITTDCKSARDKLNYGYINKWANHGQAQILQAIRNIRKEKILWTRSHPEKRMELNSYQKRD